jgi:plasmid stability protein
VAQLVVRNLDEDVKERLRRRAVAHGHSMEEEIRLILRAAVHESEDSQAGIGTRIAELFRGHGLDAPLSRMLDEAPEPASFPE